MVKLLGLILISPLLIILVLGICQFIDYIGWKRFVAKLGYFIGGGLFAIMFIIGIFLLFG